MPAAQREAQNAAAVGPEVPQPYYILGLIAKLQNKPEEALAAFQRVLKIDPGDVATNINVGQIYSPQRKYPEAIAAVAGRSPPTYNRHRASTILGRLLRAARVPMDLRQPNAFSVTERAALHHWTELLIKAVTPSPASRRQPIC